MSVYFSDNLTDSSANTTLVTGFKASVSIRHARKRVSIARVTTADATGFQTTDVVRMITLKSSDRLLGLELATDGAASAGAVNVGVYLTGAAHDGAVADADIFATAVVISSETDLVDIMDENTLVDGIDRGRAMWQIVTLGSGTNYTTDPNIEFDITLVPSTNFDADNELSLKATYTAGD